MWWFSSQRKITPPSLFKILDEWCLASGAKFNKEKTIVITIGSPNYRKNVIETRKTNPNSNFTFNASITILRDGESMRYLGTQIGNKLSGNEAGPKIVDEIELSLKKWEKAYPGIEGMRHIIQMVIGSKTQFITTAQGMPCKYKNLLNKRIHTFLCMALQLLPPVTSSIMSTHHQKGGTKVLNIKVRNKA